jgi:hypothetical protein
MAKNVTAAVVVIVLLVATVASLSTPSVPQLGHLIPKRVKGTGIGKRLLVELVAHINSMNSTGIAALFEDDATGTLPTGCQPVGKAQLVQYWTQRIDGMRRLASFPKIIVDSGAAATALLHDMAISKDNSIQSYDIAITVEAGATGKIQNVLALTDAFIPTPNATAMIGTFDQVMYAISNKSSKALGALMAHGLQYKARVGGYEPMPTMNRFEFDLLWEVALADLKATTYSHSFGRPMAMCNWLVYPVSSTFAGGLYHFMSNAVIVAQLDASFKATLYMDIANLVGATL